LEKQNTSFPKKRCVLKHNLASYFTKQFQATFEEAKNICQKDNMELSSFNNIDEINKVNEYLNYIGKIAEH